MEATSSSNSHMQELAQDDDNSDVEDGVLEMGHNHQSIPRKRRRTSSVWNYFSHVPDAQMVRCNSCGSTFNWRDNYGTTNLQSHLAKCRGVDYQPTRRKLKSYDGSMDHLHGYHSVEHIVPQPQIAGVQVTKNRITSTIELPPRSIGSRYNLVIHDYFPSDGSYSTDVSQNEYYSQDRAYIQASLHADELPGLLVTHHLIKLLDAASSRGAILKQITVVPYANPLGLAQDVMGTHFGRFSLSTGVNFNRDWIDVTDTVALKVADKLDATSGTTNVAVIRKAILEATNDLNPTKIEDIMKKELYKRAAISSVVLDLHCDTDAVMHMYTHDHLWPAMIDLSQLLGSRATILAPKSGGNPFDESVSCSWASLADKFPNYPIPMGCQSATVELRGEADVYDDLAVRDARAVFQFLVKRGFLAANESLISDADLPPVVEATPLNGVDMIEAPASGLLAWRVRPGDIVTEGQILGELVNIENVDAPRIGIRSRTAGIVFGMRRHTLAVPGSVVIKVAGNKPLSWRTGNLLTAK